MEGNIHQHLVKSPVNKRCIDRDDRVHSAIGQTGSTGYGVLFRNAHVDHSLGILLRHAVEPSGAKHGSGDTHHPRVSISQGHHFLSKHAGPRGGVRGLHVFPGGGINLAHRVKLVSLIIARRSVASTFFGNHVDDDRRTFLLGLVESYFNVFDVVPIDGPQVLDIEVGIEVFVIGEAGEEPSRSPAKASVEGPPWCAKETEKALGRGLESSIGTLGAHLREEPGNASNGGRIGAPVVIDHQNQVALVIVRNIVQSFPGHTAGKSAISDNSHDVAVILTGHLKSPGNSFGPAQAARGVRAFHDVML